MKRKAIVHIALCRLIIMESQHDILTLIFSDRRRFREHIPVMINRKHDVVVCGNGLHRSIKYTEGSLEPYSVCGNIIISHIVPILIVDFVSHNPVGNLPVTVLSVITLSKERSHGLYSTEATLRLHVKTVIHRLFLGKFRHPLRIQLRNSLVPSIKQNRSYRNAGIAQPLHLRIQLVNQFFINFVRLVFIGIGNAVPEETLCRNIHTGMLDF